MPFSFQKFPRMGELAHLPRREHGEGAREDGVGPAACRGSCMGQRGWPVPGAALCALRAALHHLQLPATPRRSRGSEQHSVPAPARAALTPGASPIPRCGGVPLPDGEGVPTSNSPGWLLW